MHATTVQAAWMLVVTCVAVVNGRAAINSCNGPPAVIASACCRIPSMFASATFKVCNPSIAPSAKSAAKATPNKCMGDCLFKESKLLAGNDLSVSAVKTFYANGVNSVWTPVMNAAVAYCLENVVSDKSVNNCKTKADRFMTCTNLYVFRNCPATVWNNSVECNGLKTYIQQCPFGRNSVNSTSSATNGKTVRQLVKRSVVVTKPTKPNPNSADTRATTSHKTTSNGAKKPSRPSNSGNKSNLHHTFKRSVVETKGLKLKSTNTTVQNKTSNKVRNHPQSSSKGTAKTDSKPKASHNPVKRSVTDTKRPTPIEQSDLPKRTLYHIIPLKVSTKDSPPKKQQPVRKPTNTAQNAVQQKDASTPKTTAPNPVEPRPSTSQNPAIQTFG